MTDRAYIVIRTLENKIAIAENNDQNTLWVTLDVLKEILALLKEQDKIIQNILLEKTNELNNKVATLQIESQNQEMRRLLEQK